MEKRRKERKNKLTSLSYLTKIRRAKYSKRAKEMNPMLTKIQMIRGQISSEVGIAWVVIVLNIARGTTDPRVEFIFSK